MRRLALVLAAVATLSFAKWPVRAANAEAPVKTSRISVAGQVLDPQGKPVAGARVILREWSSLRYSEDPTSEIDDQLAETKSAADGSFRFERVPARPFKRFDQYTAPWDVIAFAPGFGPAWVHLQQADTPQLLELELAASQSISGQLVDAAGKPIVAGRIELVCINSLSGSADAMRQDFSDPRRLDIWRSRIASSTKSDANGRFDLADMPADRQLTFRSTHPEFIDSVFFAATTTVPQPPITRPSIENGRVVGVETPVYLAGFQHQLLPGCRVRGRVVFADSGDPASNARVSLSSGNRLYPTRTNKNGEFELSGLPEEEFDLTTSTELSGYLGSRQPVKFTKDNRRHEVTISLDRGESVSGRVVDAETGGGVAGVVVSHVPPDALENSNWSPAKAATSGPQGEFEMFLPAGPGALRIGGGIDRHPTHDVPDHWRWRSKEHLSPGNSVAIDVKPGEAMDDVRLTVTRGLIVRGQAVNSEGKPIPLAKVETADQFGRPEFAKNTITDEEGRFQVAGFPPHEELQLTLTDSIDHLRATAHVVADPAANETRSVDLGPVELRGTATITGRVLGDGKPLAGAKVMLSVVVFRDGDSMQTSQGGVATTGPDGKFTLDSVEPSKECYLYATCDGYTDQGSHPISLKSSESRAVTPFELKSRSSFVAGIVVDPDGNPVQGATVSAMQRDGNSISFGRRGPPVPTGNDGRFRLDDLPNVPLQLLAYIQPPAGNQDRSIHFPARVDVEPGDADVRILLDPKLQRPLP